MEIKVNTNSKTITLLGKVNLAEFKEFAEKFTGDTQWEEWTVGFEYSLIANPISTEQDMFEINKGSITFNNPTTPELNNDSVHPFFITTNTVQA